MIQEAYVQGVSTRSVDEQVQAMGMSGISKSQVSHLAGEIVVGIFPNDAAIVRLVGVMLLEQKDEWSLQRRYMQLEGLQSLSDSQTARLSAVIS